MTLIDDLLERAKQNLVRHGWLASVVFIARDEQLIDLISMAELERMTGQETLPPRNIRVVTLFMPECSQPNWGRTGFCCYGMPPFVLWTRIPSTIPRWHL